LGLSPSTIDSLIDSPSQSVADETDTGLGSQITGNYATLNALDTESLTLSNGNLDITNFGSSRQTHSTILPSSGKWYAEFTCNAAMNDVQIGVANNEGTGYVGANSNSWGVISTQGNRIHNGGQSSYGSVYTTGDLIMVALDLDNGKWYMGKNGTWFNSGNPVNGTNPAHTGLIGNIGFAVGSNATGGNISCNFGQRAFDYTAPTNFKSLNTANLPTPTIADGSKYFDTKLYAGNQGTQSITMDNSTLSPDWVWIKCRNDAFEHQLFDSVRGALKSLRSDNASAEATVANSLTSFDSNGFSLGVSQPVNNNKNYAAWAWEAGSSTVANTTGSINSQVRASATSGFSIVSYTGTASNATIGHGLSSAPDAVITKCLTGTNSWAVYHRYSGNGGALLLNVNNAEDASSAYWNNTHATNTVFSVGASAQTNGSSQPFIAYCFSPVESYSSFGSWIGTGNADGPFLYTGFRPAWIMYKKKNGSSNWVIRDTKRSPSNVSDITLVAESAEVEGNSSIWNVDILSNGFKIRTTQTSSNNSGDTYVYFAFAENPFSSARAR
jgi:hypothetical protein